MDFSKSLNRTRRLNRFHHAEKLYSRVWLYVLRIACVLVLILGVSAAGILLGTFMGIVNEAPEMSLDSFTLENFNSYVYDRDGNQIAQLKTEINRIYVPLNEMSPYLIQAVTSVEDDRFYEHNGIDIEAILRAGVSQLRGGSGGGSTITQQLIKNMVLSSKQTLARKFQEWYLALNLEHSLREQYGKSRAKEMILETYLNYVNYGNSAYGPEAAAQRYFGKSCKDLTISEAAVLGGVINAPTRYDPIANRDGASRERQEWVLKRMFELGNITEEEYQEALNDNVFERIANYNATYKEESEEQIYDYYMDAAINQAIEDLSEQKGISLSEASRLLYYGGYKLYIAQDPHIQQVMNEVYADDSNFLGPNYTWIQATYYLSIFDEKNPDDGSLTQNKYFVGLYRNMDSVNYAVEEFKAKYLKEGMEAGVDYVERLETYIEPQSTAVLMDQHTGYVLGIVGGRGEKTSSRSLNRATDSPRQPGSTFKVIAAFAGAIDSGYSTPATVYDDAPFTYYGWTVHNWYGDYYKGLSTIRQGIANSMNVVASKSIIDYGVENAFEYVKSFGFTTLREEPDENGITDVVPSLALGSGSVTNLELTAAYAAIANGGVYIEPMFYTRIEDSEGNLVLEKVPETHRVIKETTAWLLTDMMEDVVTGANEGTGTSARFNYNMGIAGKTGTTSDDNDLWFVGYTPYYTMGIWDGFDYNSYKNVSDDEFTMINGSIHTRRWATIMAPLHEGLEDKQFEMPDGITSAYICTESGLLATSLCSADPRGGTVRLEYFDVNNVPTSYCKTHVGGTVCSESHMAPTEYCPETTSGVFIQRTEEQLAEIDMSQVGKIQDWQYEVPSGFSADSTQTCNIHTKEWYEEEQKKKEEEEKKKKEEEEAKKKEEEEAQKQEEGGESSTPEATPTN